MIKASLSLAVFFIAAVAAAHSILGDIDIVAPLTRGDWASVAADPQNALALRMSWHFVSMGWGATLLLLVAAVVVPQKRLPLIITGTVAFLFLVETITSVTMLGFAHPSWPFLLAAALACLLLLGVLAKRSQK